MTTRTHNENAVIDLCEELHTALAPEPRLPIPPREPNTIEMVKAARARLVRQQSRLGLISSDH